MNLKTASVLSIAILLFISCSSQSDKSVLQLENFHAHVDTIILNDTDVIAGNPFAWQHMKDFKDGDAFISYYPNLQKIKLYDLKNNRDIITFSTAKIEYEFGSFQSLWYHNRDSIFYLFENAIFLSNVNGEFNLLEKINDSALINQKGYFIHDLYGGQMFYSKNQLILPVTYFEGGRRENYPVFGKYDLKNKSFESIGIKYPENYRKNYYGFAEYIYSAFQDDYVLLSFQCNDSIYKYHIFSGKMSSKDSKNPERDKEFTILKKKDAKNSSLLMEKMLVSPFYGKIVFGNDGYIYRVYQDDMELKKDNGLFNTWSDKPKYLTVMNSLGDVIGNIPINKYSFVTLLGAGRDGLYFTGKSNAKIQGEKREQIYRLTLKKI